VVAAGSGGPLDLVADDVNGSLVDPRPEGLDARLRAAVTRLVHDRRLRERLASAARPSVRHRTWYAVIDELEQHYATVLQRTGTRPSVMVGP
jgi:phosphatidylinositol alpha 1,6-mannosyltransferase